MAAAGSAAAVAGFAAALVQYCKDVVDPLPTSLLVWHVEGPRDELLLLGLDLQHLFLHSLTHSDELVDVNMLLLA